MVNIPDGGDGGVEKKKRKGAENNKQEFLKDFIHLKTHDPKEKVAFLDSVFGKEAIEGDLKNDLEKYYDDAKYSILDSSGTPMNKYFGFEVSAIKMNELQRLLSPEYSKLKNKRDSFKQLILDEYDITPAKYEEGFGKNIISLDKNFLEGLIKGNHQKRKEYLEKVVGKEKMPQEKKLIDLFYKINFPDRIQKFLKSHPLSDEELHNLQMIGNRFDKGEVHSEDLKDLFELNLFTQSEKKELVHAFLPYISLKEALEIGIVDKEFARNYKINILKRVFSDNEIEVSDSDIEDLIKANGVNDDDILISTRGDNISDDHIDTISKNIALRNVDIEDQVKKFEEEKQEKEKKEKSKLTYDEFLNSLKQLRLKNADKLEAGKIVVLTLSSKMGKADAVERNIFLEVDEGGLDDGRISFLDKGMEVYTPKNKSEVSFTYDDFLKIFSEGLATQDEKNTVVKSEVLSKKEINELILKGQIKANIDSVDYDGEDEIEARKKEINAKIEARKRKLESEGKNDKEISDDSQYKALLQELDKADEINLLKILLEIDNFDSNGKKFGLQEHTTFITKKEEIYTITYVDHQNNQFKIVGINGVEETIDFNTFLALFKEKESKRTSKSKDFQALFDGCQGEIDAWKDFHLVDGEIQKKETKNDISYDYLVSEKGNEVFKINKIHGDKINVTYGEVKEGKGDDKKIIFSMEDSSFTIGAGALDTFIREHNLVPKSLDEYKDIKVEDYDAVERNGSFLTRFFNRMSIADCLAGGKVWLDSIENYLKEGNNEQAAKFASGVLGRFLPEELRTDLQTREEGEKRKRMDEYKEKLGNVDSYVAVDMIEGWLRNKDTPEFKKEAGMIFMLEKYGTLYAKGGLFKHKGKFLWYEAMGGKAGDKLFKEEQEKARKADLPFNEDELVFALINKQCKSNGYNGIKRRSRLHKEFKGLRGKGQGDELKKGLEDGSLSRNIDDRVKYGIGELDGGTYINAMGSLEAIINKGAGSEIHKLNKLPFVMAFSGEAYSFDEHMIDDFKNHLNAGRLVPTVAFLSKKSFMDLFNETVLELCKDLSDINKDPKMQERAQKIFDAQYSSQYTQKEKITRTAEFFDDYGEVLTRSLFMLNTGKTDKHSRTDKLILLKQDKPIYKKYYSFFKDYMSGNAEFTNDDFINDGGLEAGVTGIDIYKATSQNLEQTQGGGFKNKDRGKNIWKEIYKEIEAIVNPERSYDLQNNGNEAEEERLRRIVLKDTLRGFIGGLLSLHGSNTTVLFSLNGPTSPFSAKLNKWGISMKELYRNSISYSEMLDEGNFKADRLLDKYVNNILTGTGSLTNNFADLVEETRSGARVVMDNSEDQDDDTEQNPYA